MTKIILETEIQAPREVCFDLSRSIDFHAFTMVRSAERAISGRTTGLIEKDDTVTWEAVHFGFRQQLTSRIIALERPLMFIDEMEKGPFKSLKHIHSFQVEGGRTIMTDTFEYTVPYGPFGKLFDRIVLRRYMTSLLRKRNRVLKSCAESGLAVQFIHQ